MFGCFSIMIFNAIIIIRKKIDNKALKNNTKKWITTITQQLESNKETISKKNKIYLKKNLTHVKQLIAFSSALDFFKVECDKNSYTKYMAILTKNRVFQSLAHVYKKKKIEERAYFAYFVYKHPSVARTKEGACKNTTDTIASFVTTRDIYCNINVLKALCSVGDMHGIASVLQYFSEKSMFIHHKLLSYELNKFVGDKDVLAQRLWEKRNVWNDNVMLGIISFIAMFSDGYKKEFISMLCDQSVGIGIRIAIISYYKEHRFKPAQPILVDYLHQTDNYEIANKAASALRTYPGFITTNALLQALKSENWDVKYNAASSLVELGENIVVYDNNIGNYDSDVVQIFKYKQALANDIAIINESGVII